MGAVYSTRFLLKSGGNDTYTVPTGKRAIIKNVSLVNISAAAGDFSVSIGSVLVFFQRTAAVSSRNDAGLHMVANSGEVIAVSAVAYVSYQVSGYLLDNLAG